MTKYMGIYYSTRMEHIGDNAGKFTYSIWDWSKENKGYFAIEVCEEYFETKREAELEAMSFIESEQDPS